MPYQIITDSCCDFTQTQYEAHQLLRADLTVTRQGESCGNFSEPYAVKAFYEELRSGVSATTSAANPGDWKALMEPVLQQGEDVLALCFSSGLSATYQSAVMAGEELREAYPQRTIQIIDTLCASLGQGLLVHFACRQRDQGMDIHTLAQWVEETKRSICHWVTVDSLTHLQRGGRISAGTAILGTMLHVKPIICMDNQGALRTCAKVRGRKTAMDYLLAKYEETALDRSLVYIGHGDCPEDAAQLERRLREEYGVAEVVTGYVGPVIGAHTGPGVLTIFFLGMHR